MRKKHKDGGSPKPMKPGKLKGPSHAKGGIILEAEGGEYIIKKSSVKKIGKAKLDKLNKEGKLPMDKYEKGGPVDLGGPEAPPGPKRKKWHKKYDKKYDKARKIADKDSRKRKKYVSNQTDKELKKHLKKKGLWSKKEGHKDLDVNKDNFVSPVEVANAQEGLDIIEGGKKKHGDRYEKKLGHKIRKAKLNRLYKKMDKMRTKKPAYKSAKGGKVPTAGDSINTYSNGGYVEGK